MINKKTLWISGFFLFIGIVAILYFGLSLSVVGTSKDTLSFRYDFSEGEVENEKYFDLKIENYKNYTNGTSIIGGEVFSSLKFVFSTIPGTTKELVDKDWNKIHSYGGYKDKKDYCLKPKKNLYKNDCCIQSGYDGWTTERVGNGGSSSIKNFCYIEKPMIPDLASLSIIRYDAGGTTDGDRTDANIPLSLYNTSDGVWESEDLASQVNTLCNDFTPTNSGSTVNCDVRFLVKNNNIEEQDSKVSIALVYAVIDNVKVIIPDVVVVDDVINVTDDTIVDDNDVTNDDVINDNSEVHGFFYRLWQTIKGWFT